jgi:hypothetical protein
MFWDNDLMNPNSAVENMESLEQKKGNKSTIWIIRI